MTFKIERSENGREWALTGFRGGFVRVQRFKTRKEALESIEDILRAEEAFWLRQKLETVCLQDALLKPTNLGPGDRLNVEELVKKATKSQKRRARDLLVNMAHSVSTYRIRVFPGQEIPPKE